MKKTVSVESTGYFSLHSSSIGEYIFQVLFLISIGQNFTQCVHSHRLHHCQYYHRSNALRVIVHTVIVQAFYPTTARILRGRMLYAVIAHSLTGQMLYTLSLSKVSQLTSCTPNSEPRYRPLAPKKEEPWKPRLGVCPYPCPHALTSLGGFRFAY